MTQRPREVSKSLPPMRSLANRVGLLLLVASAVAIMLIGKADPHIFDQSRQTVTDVVSPVLEAVSKPIITINQFMNNSQDLLRLRAENEHLRLQNRRLLEWQSSARHLMQENTHLRQLVNFPREDVLRFVTARTIGDPGGAFVRSLVVNAGENRSVRKGQAAMVAEGLIGRVSTIGKHSSRVLLLTDLNSRLPVMVEETRTRSILAGDNTDLPKLNYLSANHEIEVGQHIVTSGYGGAFPPGLPVGRVVSNGEEGVRIHLYADPYAQEYVRLTDFGLNGILQDLEETGRAVRGQR